MAYRQAVLRDPSNAAARRRLAGTFIALERYDEARYNLDKALQSEPGHGWAQAHMGYCLHKLGEENKALVHYQRAVEIAPQDTKYKTWLAASLLKLGNAGEAQRHFKEVLAKEPGNKTARRGLRFAEQTLRQARKSD